MRKTWRPDPVPEFLKTTRVGSCAAHIRAFVREDLEAARIRSTPENPPVLICDIARMGKSGAWVIGILATTTSEMRRWLAKERSAWRHGSNGRFSYKDLVESDLPKVVSFLSAANQLRGVLTVVGLPPLKTLICTEPGDHLLESAIERFGRLKSDSQLEHRLRICAAVVAVGTCLTETTTSTIQLLFDNDEAFIKEAPFPLVVTGEEIMEALGERPVQEFLALLSAPFNARPRYFALTRPADVPPDRQEILAARDVLAIPDIAAGAFLARDRCIEANDPTLAGSKARVGWNWLLEKRYRLRRVLVDLDKQGSVITMGSRIGSK